MSPEQIELLTKRAAPGEPAVTFEFTPFAPGAASAITGASGMYQTVLRRRGILTQKDGHARFDVFGLACLMVLRMMSDRGGPKLASKFAIGAGYRIAWHALAYRDAYAGDAERALFWDAELGPKIEAWQAGVALLRDERAFRPEALAEVVRLTGDPTLAFNGWTTQATWLRDKMFQLRGFTALPVPKFLVWTPDGRTASCNSLDRAFAEDEQQRDPQLLGPVVVLDVERLGLKLLTEMKRLTGASFVTVRIGELKG